ncbi:MAG: hypothetical protein ACWGSQ_18045 [Longimicrobiales bacterium]
MPKSWLETEDVTVFVVPKVKKGFDDSLKELLREETGTEAEPVRLGDELSEWVALRVKGKKWGKGRRSPGEKALSRAFQALAAARYHLRGDPEAELELRSLRDRVEALWLASNGDERGAA